MQNNKIDVHKLQTLRLIWLLGLAGLLPFVAPAVLAALGHTEYLQYQRHYAACIVTFLGAIYWGLVLRDSSADTRRNMLLLVWGVTPSLIAWTALNLSMPWQLLLLSASLVVCFAVDIVLAKQEKLSRSYLKLRGVLTAAALVCLTVGHTLI
jgi:Protein of unknown function (DUF3429)